MQIAIMIAAAEKLFSFFQVLIKNNRQVRVGRPHRPAVTATGPRRWPSESRRHRDGHRDGIPGRQCTNHCQGPGQQYPSLRLRLDTDDPG